MTTPISSYRAPVPFPMLPIIAADLGITHTPSHHTQKSKFCLIKKQIQQCCKIAFTTLEVVFTSACFLTSSITVITGTITGNLLFISVGLPLVVISALRLYDIIKTRSLILDLRNKLPEVLEAIQKSRFCNQRIIEISFSALEIENDDWDRLIHSHQEILNQLHTYRSEIKDMIGHSYGLLSQAISRVESSIQSIQDSLKESRKESQEHHNEIEDSEKFKRYVQEFRGSVLLQTEHIVNHLLHRLEGLATACSI